MDCETECGAQRAMPDGSTSSGRRESDGGGGSSCGGRLGKIAVSREVNNEESEERSNVNRSHRTGRVQWAVLYISSRDGTALGRSVPPLLDEDGVTARD